jgi:hypothetical protein
VAAGKRTTDTGRPGHEPGQNREDKSGDDNTTRSAASGEPWTRLLGQDSWHRTARIGQLGHDVQDRTAREGRQDSTSRTGNREQESKERTAGTRQGDRTTVTGEMANYIWDRTAQTGQLGKVSLDRLV